MNAATASSTSPPGSSTITIGKMCDLPVWTSVSASNASSWVPNPPGKSTTASDSLMNISLRVKKYRMVMSFGSPWTTGLADCSNGRRMLSPKLLSRPAPRGRPP